MRRRLHTLVALLTLAATFTTAFAQQMRVNITRRQNPLPPQISVYYENPGRFFDVSVTNVDADTPVPVRLEVSLVGPIAGGADVWPVASDSYFMVNYNQSLPSSFIIPPKQTLFFSSSELNTHMMSYPTSSRYAGGTIAKAMQTPEDGKPFGLLDEGHYGIKLTVKSNFSGDSGDVLGEGTCFFDLCYSATAPTFTFPTATGFDFSGDTDIMTVNFPTDYAHFEWTTPTFNIPSLATMRQFSYDFKLYRMLPNQSPEEAIGSNGIAFQQLGLMVPYCDIPRNVVTNLQRSGTQYYVAQVTAKPVISDANNPDYTLINNSGKSNYMLLKLASEGGSGGFEDDLTVDDEDGTDEDPVKVTIETKFKEFTNELAPYFEEPAKMFRVTLENTTSEDLTISMLLQFFKDNWGVCPAPAKQHSTKSLTILAGQSVTLSDDQLNYLAGGYPYSDVIAFKAQTGFIIGKPAQNTFPGKDYTLSARICKHTGKPVLREEVLGKARADFSVASGIEAGDVFRITYETRISPLPVDDAIYFTKPSRLFTAKIENLSNLDYEVLPRLLFQDKEGEVYGGAGVNERFDQALKIGAGETVTLSGEQFDKLCGNFTKAIKITDGAPKSTDSVDVEAAMGFLGLDGAALSEISLFDVTVLRELYGNDEKAAEKAFLQAEVIEFETSLEAFIGDIDVSISPKMTEMPCNASAYFQKSYLLFDVELTNTSDRNYKVTPNLKFKLTDEDEIHTACIPDWHKHAITLKAGKSYKLTEADHELFFGSNRVITCTPGENGKYVTSDTTELYRNLDNFMDELINMDELSHAHIDVYNQELLQTIKESDFGTVKPALIGQGNCDFSIDPITYVHDVTIRLLPILDPMPGDGDAYIGKTANLWDIELVNTTNETIKGFPIIRYNFKDKEYNYAPAVSDVYKDHITLNPKEPIKLSVEQMNRYLSGSKGVRYKADGSAAPDTLTTFTDLVNLEDFNYVGVAVIDIDSINKYKGQQLPDFEARVIRGSNRLPFMADPNVSLDDVIVKITAQYDRMPENGEPYVQTPGRLFKIELTNTLDRVVKVRPSFTYEFTDTPGEYYDPWNEEFDKGDSIFTLAPLDTRELTTSEVNYVCGGSKLLHYTPDKETPDTLLTFGGLVRLTADNLATFIAFDNEQLDAVDKEDPDFMKKVTLGTGKHTFRGVEGVSLDQVSVNVRHKMNPMPGNGAYYSRIPGRLFDITITNTTQEKLAVIPVIEYYFDNGNGYHSIDYTPMLRRPLYLEPEEAHTLTIDELNELCGGKDWMLYYTNDKIARGDTIRALTDIVSLNSYNKARVVVYDAYMLQVAHELPEMEVINNPSSNFNAFEYMKAAEEFIQHRNFARIGGSDTRFEASKEVVLSDVEISITTRTPDMSDEAMPYFETPGKYLEMTLSNYGIEEAHFGVRLTLNDKYYGVTDSLFHLPPDSTIVLTEEQINRLCGGIQSDRIYQIDSVDGGGITRKVVQGEMKLSDINNNVKALAWNLPYGRQMNANGDNVDTLSVEVLPFVTGFNQIKVGEFWLTPSEMKRSESHDSCYSGKGYITWNAMGFPIKIAVEYDTLYINKDAVAYRGLVKSAKKEELLNFAPFELFESKLDSLGADELGTEVKNMLAGSDFARYYQYATETMEAIPMTFVEGSPALQLPVKLPESVSKKSPVDIQLLSMEFLPTKASMNLIAQFTLPESNYVTTGENILVFGAPHLGMSDSTLIPKSGDLALLTDLTIKDPSTGFNITFLAPGSTDIETWNVELDNNGCFVKWENGEFADFVVDAKMAIPSSDIVKVVDGTVQEEAPDIRLTASISDKEDWIAQVRFDAFEHVDAPGYTFTIGGSTVGVLYDHSKSKAPDGMTMDAFPKDYDWKLTGINEKHSEDQKIKEWQGFYFQELSVAFPAFIELDNSGEDKRLSIKAEKIIYDNSGFSMTLAAHNVVDKSTASMGGWRITLDEVYLSVLQNNFGSFGFNGRFDVPLLDGQIGYDAKVLYVDKGKETINNSPDPENTQAGSGSSTDDDDDSSGEKVLKVVFETRQVDTLSLDFFVGTMDFEKESTYFNVTYLDGDTDVELSLSGEINIAGSKSMESTVGFALPGIGFHRMRLANFVSKEVIQGNAYHFETADQSFCFDLGRWSLGGFTLGGGGGSGGSGNTDQANNSSGSGSGNGDSGNNNNNNNSGSDSGGNNSGSDSDNEDSSDDASKLDTEVEYGLNVAGFSIGLDEFSITTREQGEETHIGLYIKAKMSLVECVSATAGFTIWASFDMDTKNADYEGATFNDIGVGASIGGIVIEGSFSVKNDEDYGDGYCGTLKIALPGNLFTFNAEGGYFKNVQSDPEVSNYGKKVSWGYLEIAAGGKALGAIKPIGITELSGGFYFNCNDQKEMQYGYYGLMLGVGLSFSDESVVAGKFELQCFYDCEKDRLGRLSLRGTAHMVGGGTNKDGLLNAEMLIIYENTYQGATETHAATGEEYFQMTASVDASADMTSVAQKLISNYVELPDLSMIAPGLGDAFGQDDEDIAAADAERNRSASDEDAKSNLKASAGVKFNFDLKITFKSPQITDGKPKWHLWLGKPQPEDQRCQVTFIDFQLGDKDDALAAWAKVYVNAYFCIGNEMPVGPDGNVLPPIPDEVQEFLDGKDVNGNTQNLTSKAQQLRNEQVTKMINTAKGGLLFGAAAGASFGANLVIAYFDVSAMAGFDIALVKLADGATKCANTGREMRGLNGYYATGQAYIKLEGEIGLMIDCWLFTGKIALVEAGIGAMLQVGFAHPTWFYGKMRAKCSLFGGLITFNKAIEIEAGDVCVPYYANPLADIEIFGDVYPNYDNKEDGWNMENVVSPYAVPRFATNMQIGTDIRLLDETANAIAEASEGVGGANAERTYKFLLRPHIIEEYANPNSGEGKEILVEAVNTSGDRVNYTLKSGPLEPETCYKVTLLGYAQEYKNSTWGNPWFTDESSNYEPYQKAWGDTCEFYFRTDALPPYLTDNDIAIAPGHQTLNEGETDYAYESELLYPEIALKRSRADLFTEGTEMKMQIGFWRGSHYEYTTMEPVIEEIEAGTGYETVTWKPEKDPSDVWNPGEGNNTLFYATLVDNKKKGDEMLHANYYKLRIVRVNTAKYEQYLKDATEKMVKESVQYGGVKRRDQVLKEKGIALNEGSGSTKTIASGTTSTLGSGSRNMATSSGFTPLTGTRASTDEEETVNLGDIFEGFEGEMVTERQKDEIERRVREFEQSVDMTDFTELMYEYDILVRPHLTLAAHIAALETNKKLFTTREVTTYGKLSGINVYMTDMNGEAAKNGNDQDFIDSPYEDPYSVFTYLGDYAFIAGQQIQKYDYNKYADVLSSQSTLYEVKTDGWYSSLYSVPTVAGNWLYQLPPYEELKYVCTRDFYEESESNRINLTWSTVTDKVYYKPKWTLSSRYVFAERRKRYLPYMLPANTTEYHLPSNKYRWPVLYDDMRLYIEAQAVLAQNLSYNVYTAHFDFHELAVDRNDLTKVDGGKARDWAAIYHSRFKEIRINGDAQNISVKWRPYQIPLLYGNLKEKTREKGLAHAYLHKSIYDPEKLIKKFMPAYSINTHFSAEPYLKDIEYIEFLFVRPNRYNIKGSDGTRNVGMMVDEDSKDRNTYKLKMENPFSKSNYTFQFVNAGQGTWMDF